MTPQLRGTPRAELPEWLRDAIAFTEHIEHNADAYYEPGNHLWRGSPEDFELFVMCRKAGNAGDDA